MAEAKTNTEPRNPLGDDFKIVATPITKNDTNTEFSVRIKGAVWFKDEDIDNELLRAMNHELINTARKYSGFRPANTHAIIKQSAPFIFVSLVLFFGTLSTTLFLNMLSATTVVWSATNVIGLSLLRHIPVFIIRLNSKRVSRSVCEHLTRENVPDGGHVRVLQAHAYLVDMLKKFSNSKKVLKFILIGSYWYTLTVMNIVILVLLIGIDHVSDMGVLAYCGIAFLSFVIAFILVYNFEPPDRSDEQQEEK